MSTRAETATLHFSQASALLDAAPLRPEVVAKQLFSLTGMAQRRVRGATPEVVLALRRAYLTGVAAQREAMAHVYYDAIERLTITVRLAASSYDERERIAYAWGWEDGMHGRFGACPLRALA